MYDFTDDFEWLRHISWDFGTMGQEYFSDKDGERIRDIVNRLEELLETTFEYEED